MNSRLKGVLAVAGSIAALAAGGVAIAGATGGSDEGNGGRDDGNGTPVAGSDFSKAKAAALEQTGGGKVTGSELRDEEGYYEVEVTKGDGSQTDVHMDRNFKVLDAQSDGSGPDDSVAGN